jgi:hypothetical protein
LGKETVTSTQQVSSLLNANKEPGNLEIMIDRNGRIGSLPVRYLPK